VADDDAKGESLDINDLLRTLISRLTGIEDVQKELREGQKEANEQQAQTNVHLTQINGTLSTHERSIRSHSGKLEDQGGAIAELSANQRVIMATTKLRDEHLSAGVRDATLTGWESRTEAMESSRQVRGWVWDIARLMIAIAAVLAVLALTGVLG